MNRIDRCLSQIRDVRDVADGNISPYVARSRIGRLSLSIANLVAETASLPTSDLPSPITIANDAPLHVREIAERCNRLMLLSRRISQPSEPLEDRWTRSWHELLREIDLIEVR